MKIINIIVLSVLMLTGCSTLSTTEKNSKRAELDAMADHAISGLLEQDSSLQTVLNKSLGFAVVNMKVTKVPLVGAGGGEGVFVNKKTNKRTYLTVSRFDIGGGWGVRSYKALIVIDDQQVLDKFRNGRWEFKSGVEASAGTAAAQGSLNDSNEGFSVHVLSDGGASATATIRVIRLSINTELTKP